MGFIRSLRSAISFTLLALVLSTHVLADKITVATSEYAPFTTSDGKHGGFVNRVIAEAFKRKGVEVEFKYLPWKRAVEMSTDGTYVGLSFSFENEERAKNFYFSNPLSEHKELLFHLKSTKVPEWDKITDLKDFKFAATRGYTYTKEFWSAAQSGALTVQETANDEQNFKKLAGSRVDLFPMDEITGWNLLATKLPTIKDTLTTDSKPIRVTKGFLCISKQAKNGEELIKLFNAGLDEMTADGTYNQYFNDLMSGEF